MDYYTDEEEAGVMFLEDTYSDSDSTASLNGFVVPDSETSEDMSDMDFSDPRPPRPSPPSSSAMNHRSREALQSRQHRVMRLRNRVPLEEISQSEDDSSTSSQMSTSNPPSPAVSMPAEESVDSPESVISIDNRPDSESELVPHSPDYSSSPSRSRSPQNVQNTPPAPLDPPYDPESPPYYPPPRTPPLPPPEIEQLPPSPSLLNQDGPNNGNDSDVQVIEPPVAEVPGALAPQPETAATTSVSALNCSSLTDIDDNSLCSICMDPLTNAGGHRVCCLSCGHIFGQSCVTRWIKVGCNNGAKRCPTCNKRANLKDIRVLYLPKVVPLDTVEKERLAQEKEMVIAEKNALEIKLAKCKLESEFNRLKYEKKIAKLIAELDEANTKLELLAAGKKVPMLVTSEEANRMKVELHTSVEISKDGGCRVMAFNKILQELVVSQPSGNTLFAGYGVRVLNSVNYQPARYVFLHSKMIRDLAFHPSDRDLLLSASLDRTAKLVDLASGTTVHTFKEEGPLWSCCWDSNSPHMLLVGSHMGKVCQYDRRMTDTNVASWTNEQNTTPVVALASVPAIASTPFPQGGFLSCRLNALYSFRRNGEAYLNDKLPFEGPFMSMRYDGFNQSLLTSSRPSSQCPYATINLNLLDTNQAGRISVHQIHTFNCGSSARVMSRMTTVPRFDDTLVVAHHESGRTLNLWSTKTGNLEYASPIREPVIDVVDMTDNSSKITFAALSEKKVCIYKVT